MFKSIIQSGFSAVKRTTQLKNLIRSNQLEFIMEAHNGLSALIVEEAGFKGIHPIEVKVSGVADFRCLLN